jgi:hypothetical protein
VSKFAADVDRVAGLRGTDYRHESRLRSFDSEHSDRPAVLVCHLSLTDQDVKFLLHKFLRESRRNAEAARKPMRIGLVP